MSQTQNQKTYASSKIVRYYRQLNQLQPAEQMLLDRLRPRLSQMTMLDMGVGAGRTTQHFHRLVDEYVGVDVSAQMIEACQQRFPMINRSQLQVGDACDLSQFADSSFDFVLFSFNGIDYVSQSDRLRVLSEIARVSRPGAIFCFSTHNLQGFEQSLSWKAQFVANPIVTYTNLIMRSILGWMNRSIDLTQIHNEPYAIVKDESHNFQLDTYYIRPQAQIQQLQPYFQDIEVYSWRNDVELVSEGDRLANEDLWLYYYCTLK